MPKALGTEDNPSTIRYESDRCDLETPPTNVVRRRNKEKKNKRKKGPPDVKSKEWILNKKEQRSKKGLKTANPSAYTGQRRGPKF